MLYRSLIFSAFAAFFLAYPTMDLAQAATLASVPPTNTSPVIQAMTWYTTGDVLQVHTDTAPDGTHVQTVRVRVKDGEESGDAAGKDLTVLVPLEGPLALKITNGSNVVLKIDRGTNGSLSADIQENSHAGIWVALLIAMLLLAFIGRKQGVLIVLLSVISTLAVIFFAVPLILRGLSPAWAATLTVAALTGVFSLLTFGWTKSAAAEALGTAVTFLVTMLIAWGLIRLTGVDLVRSPRLDVLRSLPGIQADSLPFAMILLVPFGAILRMASTITATIFLERRQHPDRDLLPLLEIGMAHGRTVLASISKTAIWALLGLALPTFVLAGARVSVLHMFLFGESVLYLVIVAVLLIGASLAIPIVTVAAGVLASSDR